MLPLVCRRLCTASPASSETLCILANTLCCFPGGQVYSEDAAALLWGECPLVVEVAVGVMQAGSLRFPGALLLKAAIPSLRFVPNVQSYQWRLMASSLMDLLQGALEGGEPATAIAGADLVHHLLLLSTDFRAAIAGDPPGLDTMAALVQAPTTAAAIRQHAFACLSSLLYSAPASAHLGSSETLLRFLGRVVEATKKRDPGPEQAFACVALGNLCFNDPCLSTRLQLSPKFSRACKVGWGGQKDHYAAEASSKRLDPPFLQWLMRQSSHLASLLHMLAYVRLPQQPGSAGAKVASRLCLILEGRSLEKSRPQEPEDYPQEVWGLPVRQIAACH